MAFIMNFQSPKSIDDIVDRYYFDGLTNIDHILRFNQTLGQWTVDKTAEKGEPVFFSCAKTSIDHMARILKEFKCECDFYEDKEELLDYIIKEKELYKQFAGKIIAVGKVGCTPFQVHDTGYSFPAWSSSWYAEIHDFKLLESPLEFSEIKDYIQISRTGSRTKLTEKQCAQLILQISEQNSSVF